ERFHARWSQFHHIGDVPDEEQRQDLLNQNACERFNEEQRTESTCGVLGSRTAAEASHDKGPNRVDDDAGSSDGGDSLEYPELDRGLLNLIGNVDSAPASKKQTKLLIRRFKWLVDTGCGHYLISKTDAEKLGLKFCTFTPLAFETAGGIVTTDRGATVRLPELNETVKP
ncbi:MAG: hypothetical protein GY772_09350, partial [bacterium]|nr:hypothetical protein [bacterium]